jgi:hypothetical protein
VKLNRFKKPQEECVAEAMILKGNWDERHFIEQSALLSIHQQKHKLSERMLAEAFDLPKSSVHRLLSLKNLQTETLNAAVFHGVDKYVLFGLAEIKDSALKSEVEAQILSGQMLRYKQLKTLIKDRKWKSQCLNAQAVAS